MRGDQPATIAGVSAESGTRPAEIDKHWTPADYAASEHRELLREVAGLIADGLEPDDAAEVVGVDIQGEKLPARFSYMPSPATIAAGCLDVQATWDANERHRRNVLPAERWELAEASASAVSTERSDYCGLLR